MSKRGVCRVEAADSALEGTHLGGEEQSESHQHVKPGPAAGSVQRERSKIAALAGARRLVVMSMTLRAMLEHCAGEGHGGWVSPWA